MVAGAARIKPGAGGRPIFFERGKRPRSGPQSRGARLSGQTERFREPGPARARPRNQVAQRRLYGRSHRAGLRTERRAPTLRDDSCYDCAEVELRAPVLFTDLFTALMARKRGAGLGPETNWRRLL